MSPLGVEGQGVHPRISGSTKACMGVYCRDLSVCHGENSQESRIEHIFAGKRGGDQPQTKDEGDANSMEMVVSSLRVLH